MVTSEYPKFKLAIHDPSNPRLKPQILDPKDSDFEIKIRDLSEDRRIVAIMPATGATALFAAAGNGERAMERTQLVESIKKDFYATNGPTLRVMSRSHRSRMSFRRRHSLTTR
jgi:hypothetical protein